MSKYENINSPNLSVITVVRNSVSTIRDCIESVKRQSYPAEHIIIDGASDDGTLEIIQEYKSSVSQFISEPDKGIYDAMNKGIKLASGDIIGILNSDDLYPTSDTLSEVAKVFEKKNIDSCYGDLVYVNPIKTDKTRRYWRSGYFNPRRFYFGWMPPHPTFFVRRSVYEKYGFFNLALGSAADYELMLRFLLKYKISTTYLPHILVKMRNGGESNASLKNRIRANKMDRMAWKINGLKPHTWTLWMKPLRKIGQYFTNPKGSFINFSDKKHKFDSISKH